MKIKKNENGKIELAEYPSEISSTFKESLERYLNLLDPLFETAQEKCEFEFILTLLHIRGLQDVGWDPFENTQILFDKIIDLIQSKLDYETSLSITLWLYGHIVEASEPYEILANLFRICEGGRYCISNFPPKGKNKNPLYPSEKISKLNELAIKDILQNSMTPFCEFFDRNLRNAIFHSDYVINGGDVNILNPKKRYSNSEITEILNKALAYFTALNSLLRIYKVSYDKPKIVDVHPEFSNNPNEKVITIIRENDGLIGLKDNWNKEERGKGYIFYRVGRFTYDEVKLLDSNLDLCYIKSSNAN